MKTTVEVQYNEQCDEYFIEIPQEMLDKAGLTVGDTIVWKRLSDNSWSIQKKGDSDDSH